jgi:CPA2 family monovalent cation:H+ antiporter-2
VGLVQFAGATAAGFGLATLIGFSPVQALYLGLALSTSSTLVVIHQLKQQQQMFEPFGRLVIGVLLVQDLLMILLIVGLSRWLHGYLAVAQGLAATVGMAAIAVACQRWVLPYLMMRLKLDDETLLLIVLAVLFGFIGLAYLVNVSPVAGAFLAGFAMARFPVNGVARGLLSSLGDFFRAIFFTAMGSLVVISDGTLVWQAAVLAVAIMLITPPLVAIVAEWQGMLSRPATESGLLLAQTSEFALVLGLTGTEVLKQIEPRIFSLIALVAVMTMTLTPFVATDRFTTFLLHLHPLRRRMKPDKKISGHTLVLGFGAGGMWVVKPLQQAGHNVLVVDDDPGVIDQLTRMKIASLRGDGADEKVLEMAGAQRARLILASMRRVEDTELVLRHVRGVPVVARVFENSEADRVRQLGGVPILNSLAAAETFTQWFDKTMRAQPEPG